MKDDVIVHHLTPLVSGGTDHLGRPASFVVQVKAGGRHDPRCTDTNNTKSLSAGLVGHGTFNALVGHARSQCRIEMFQHRKMLH